MIAYRSFHIPKSQRVELISDTISVVHNGQIVPLGSTLSFGSTSGTYTSYEIGNNVVGCNGLFSGKTTFNDNVQMPDNIMYANRMFFGCEALNQNIHISNNLIDGTSMFGVCENLNQNLQLPSGLLFSSGMFEDCIKFNQNIYIPDAVWYADRMFDNCPNLNQNIHLPNNLILASWMFRGCSNLNQNIKIPNGTISMYEMFRSCTKLRQSIHIPASVTTCASAFAEAPCNLYFEGNNQTRFNTISNKFELLNISNLFGNPNNSSYDRTKRRNLFFNDELRVFNVRYGSVNSIVGVPITWTKATNCFYNTLYNIYCYNNYRG